jgi:Flp pilus assembly protein TadD
MVDVTKAFEDLCSLGYSQFQSGNDEEAIITFEKAVGLAQKLGDKV